MAEPRKFLFDGLLLGLVLGLGAFFAAPCALHDESLAVLGRPAPPAAAASTPLAAALRQFVQWLGAAGVDTYSAVLGITAGAYGLSIVFVHAAARAANASRGPALATATLLATCPAATVAAATLHDHALLLLLASIGTWLAASTAARPSWPLALALGTLLGVAAAAVPIGLLLPTVLLPLLLLEPVDRSTGCTSRGQRRGYTRRGERARAQTARPSDSTTRPQASVQGHHGTTIRSVPCRLT